jgi:hypothetical protein
MADDQESHNSQSPIPSGGVGVRPSGRASLADMRLLRRAMRAGWTVPPEGKELAPRRMVEVLRDDKAGERSWVAASKTLIAMDQATLASVDVALRVKAAQEIEERLGEIERRLNEADGSTEQA